MPIDLAIDSLFILALFIIYDYLCWAIREESLAFCFRIKFDGKGQKTVTALHLAPIPSNPADLEFIVGSRVIALYEEEQSSPQVRQLLG